MIKIEYEKKNHANFLKYLENNHMTNSWKNANKPLTNEDFQADKLQRTYVRIIKYYHPDKIEMADGGLEMFY